MNGVIFLGGLAVTVPWARADVPDLTFLIVGGLAVAIVHGMARADSKYPWFGCLGWMGAFATFMAAAKFPGGLPCFTTIVLILFLSFPWALAFRVAIPLRLTRLSWYLARMSVAVWDKDVRGGACLGAALALGRRGAVPDPATLEWLRARLAALKPLRGAGVAALGFVEAARGDVDAARALLASVEEVHELAAPPTARVLAAEWRAAEAAARGDWTEVERIGRARRPPRNAMTRFLGAVAARFLGRAPVPGNAKLVLSWLLAGRRLRTWRLVRRALAAPREAIPFADALEDELPESGGQRTTTVRGRALRLRRALALHASLWREARVFPADLRRLGRTWDKAVHDGGTRKLAADRARTLGLPGGEATLRTLGQEVQEDLVALARRAGCALEEDERSGELLRTAARRLRHDLLTEIELTAKRMAARADEKRALPAVDEWREWVAFRATCERAFDQCGMTLRRLAFPTLNEHVTHFGCWLFNVRQEKAIANAIFRWLLDVAHEVGDTRAIELQTKNDKCGVT